MRATRALLTGSMSWSPRSRSRHTEYVNEYVLRGKSPAKTYSRVPPPGPAAASAAALPPERATAPELWRRAPAPLPRRRLPAGGAVGGSDPLGVARRDEPVACEVGLVR